MEKNYTLSQLKDSVEPAKIAEQLPTLMNKFDSDFLDKGKPIANLLGYFYHYIELPSNLSMEAVTTIFEKLNTTGQSLNIFEILTAKFYGMLNLREIWQDTKNKHLLISRFTKDEKDTTLAILILKAILLKKSIDDPKFSALECKRKNLLEDVSPLDVKAYWDDISSSFERGLSKLSDEYGTPSLDFLPYTTMLVPFSVIVNFVENKLHVSQKGSAYRKLESWYWSSVFSGAYDSATDTRSKTDVGQLIEWIKGGVVPSIVDKFDVKSINFDEIADGAKYKGILNLIIKNGCSDLCTGELASMLIKNSPKNVDVHHVFPVKFLERRYGDKSEQFKKREIVLNKTIIRDETNRTYIKDDLPSVYLAGIARVNPKLEEALKNHLLPIASLRADDFDRFLNERKDAITTKIEELTKFVL